VSIIRRAMSLPTSDQGHETWKTFGSEHGYLTLLSVDEHLLAPGSRVAPRSVEPGVDAELLMMLLEGNIAYEDSNSRGALLSAGELLHISVANGLRFTETNPSSSARSHLIQLAFTPRGLGRTPRREQKRFSVAQRHGKWCLVATEDGRHNSLRVDQDTSVLVALLDVGQHVVHALAAGRAAWVHVVRGSVSLGGVLLATGDSTEIENEPSVSITARAPSEILLIELANPSVPAPEPSK
jgi:quercetin 2,3-dioxygenase